MNLINNNNDNNNILTGMFAIVKIIFKKLVNVGDGELEEISKLIRKNRNERRVGSGEEERKGGGN